MKIKNKLNVLLMGGCIALTSTNYAGKLELVYLQNVIQYLKTPGDLFNFLQVSKKCQWALKSCKTNFIPVYDERTYNLTHNAAEFATQSDYISHHSGEAHLDENLNFIVNTPNFEGVLQGDIEVTKFYDTKFRNAKILDSEKKTHKCGDVTLSVRMGKLRIGSKYFKKFNAISLEEKIFYTPNKTFFVNMFYYSDDSFDEFLSGEITGEKTVKKLEGESLPWYEITYKNAKIGGKYFGDVVLTVFMNFFIDQYNPDRNSKISLKHIQNARNLEPEKLKNVSFMQEVCFGDLPDEQDENNNKLTIHEKQICKLILDNSKFETTTLSFYLKSKFATRQYWEKRYSPKQYKKIYGKSMADVLQDTYDLDKNIAELIEASSYKRIIVVEVEEGCIVSLPNALQGDQPIVETENGFKACIPNISYKITEDCIKDFRDFFPEASEDRIRELKEKNILVAFPKEMVTSETGYRPWGQPKVFIINHEKENLIVVGEEFGLREKDFVLIAIPLENLNDVHIGNIIYETKHTSGNLMLEWQPSQYGRHVMIFQMQ